MICFFVSVLIWENGADTDRRVFWEGAEVSKEIMCSCYIYCHLNLEAQLRRLASSDFCCNL